MQEERSFLYYFPTSIFPATLRDSARWHRGKIYIQQCPWKVRWEGYWWFFSVLVWHDRAYRFIHYENTKSSQLWDKRVRKLENTTCSHHRKYQRVKQQRRLSRVRVRQWRPMRDNRVRQKRHSMRWWQWVFSWERYEKLWYFLSSRRDLFMTELMRNNIFIKIKNVFYIILRHVWSFY